MMDLIYLLEDDDSIRKLVIYALNSQGYEAKGFERPAEFWKAMEPGPARPGPAGHHAPGGGRPDHPAKAPGSGGNEEAARHHAHGQEHGV
ncbi:MAG: hypothetical protein ACLUNZ_07565 [Evtepia sp.]